MRHTAQRLASTRRVPLQAAAVLLWPFPSYAWAGAAAFCSTAELCGLSLGHNGFFSNRGLSQPELLLLAAVVVTTWVVGAWISWAILEAVPRIAAQSLPVNGSRLVRLVAHALWTIGILAYLVSWFFFMAAGVFPDIYAMRFAARNANMLSHYLIAAEPFRLTCSVLTLTVAIIAVRFTLNQRRHIVPTNRDKWLVKLFVVSMAAIDLFVCVRVYARNSIHSAVPSVDQTARHRIWPPLGFELVAHCNPAAAVLYSAISVDAHELEGDIPASALKPRTMLSSRQHAHAIAPHSAANVILVVVESLRSDAVRAIHQQKPVMPHLAALVRDGIFFPNCYSQSTHSDYSDPSIVSSLYPLRSAVPHVSRRNEPWPKQLLFDPLKRAGYSTAMFSSQNEWWGNMRLFYESSDLDLFVDSETYGGSTTPGRGFFAEWMKKNRLSGKLDDAITTDLAIEWLTKQAAVKRPFCMSVNLQTSHMPYALPKGVDGPFQPSGIDFDVSLLDIPSDKVPLIRNAYFNALNYVDGQIGKIVATVSALGLSNETIIVVTGDHGEAFLENGQVGHAQTPLETTTKVGCVFSRAGSHPYRVDDYLMQSIDIVPTIIAEVGLPGQPEFQGINVLSPERPPINNRLVFIHCRTPFVASDALISGTGWKAIMDYSRLTLELYCRPNDLSPQEDVSAQYKKVADILHRTLREWRRRQLLFYSEPIYYVMYCAPAEPALTDDEVETLRASAQRY